MQKNLNYRQYSAIAHLRKGVKDGANQILQYRIWPYKDGWWAQIDVWADPDSEDSYRVVLGEGFGSTPHEALDNIRAVSSIYWYDLGEVEFLIEVNR